MHTNESLDQLLGICIQDKAFKRRLVPVDGADMVNE